MALRPSNRTPQVGSTRVQIWTNEMTASERLDEVAAILAVGLSRLWVSKSSIQSADFRESSLDFAAEQSGPAKALKDGGLA